MHRHLKWNETKKKRTHCIIYADGGGDSGCPTSHQQTPTADVSLTYKHGLIDTPFKSHSIANMYVEAVRTPHYLDPILQSFIVWLNSKRCYVGRWFSWFELTSDAAERSDIARNCLQ